MRVTGKLKETARTLVRMRITARFAQTVGKLLRVRRTARRRKLLVSDCACAT